MPERRKLEFFDWSGSNMQDFKLALVQHGSLIGHKAENLERSVHWIRQAKDQGAQLVLLPELGLSGHGGHAAATSEKEPVPDGPSVQALASLARQLDLYICAGICEDDLGMAYNTQFIVGPEGYIGKQRKVHLSMDEYFLYRAGSLIKTFELPFARVGIIICYDNLFPEMSRCMTLQGAEVLLCPHAARHFDGNSVLSSSDLEYRKNVVKLRKEEFVRLHSVRSYDNGVFVGLCNMAGDSAVDYPGVLANHAGTCVALDPAGRLIAQSVSEDLVDELVIADLKASLYDERRDERNFNLKTRKPELYGQICKPTE
jgi:predicted amidohydrolase